MCSGDFRQLACALALVSVAALAVPPAAKAEERPWEALESASQRFMELIVKSEGTEAWKMLAPTTRATMSLDDFNAATALYQGPSGALLELQTLQRQVVSENCAGFIQAVRFEHAEIRTTIQFCPIEDAWPVNSFSVDEAISVDLEQISRNMVVPYLESISDLSAQSYSCPGIDNAAVGSTQACFIGFGSGCIVEASLLILDVAFVVTRATHNEYCAPKLFEGS